MIICIKILIFSAYKHEWSIEDISTNGQTALQREQLCLLREFHKLKIDDALGSIFRKTFLV